MSAQTHTPGPWRAAPSGQIVGGPTKVRQICKIWNTRDREQDLANASLLAAAPDLLTALQDLLFAYEDPENTGSTHDEKVAAARAAISKATA
ncbi:hypothetical protein ACIPL1_24925 [Pseudomonas sp. NPDC090202]|uniref:hypothetical protein n=1 Tax=Pseudomonas sp. NPDC090202 TaxID=3364476 RepID=UPI003813B68E